jgi:hypothetical protein
MYEYSRGGRREGGDVPGIPSEIRELTRERQSLDLVRDRHLEVRVRLAEHEEVEESGGGGELGVEERRDVLLVNLLAIDLEVSPAHLRQRPGD